MNSFIKIHRSISIIWKYHEKQYLSLQSKNVRVWLKIKLFIFFLNYVIEFHVIWIRNIKYTIDWKFDKSIFVFILSRIIFVNSNSYLRLAVYILLSVTIYFITKQCLQSKVININKKRKTIVEYSFEKRKINDSY